MDYWRRKKSTENKNHPQNVHSIKLHQHRRNRLTSLTASPSSWKLYDIWFVSTTTLPVTGKSECKHVSVTTFHFTRAKKSQIFFSPAREISGAHLWSLVCVAFPVHSIKPIWIKLSRKTTSPTSQQNPSRNSVSQTTSLLKKINKYLVRRVCASH